MLTNKFLPSELRPSPLGPYAIGSTAHVACLSASISGWGHRTYPESEYEILSSCDPSPRQIQRAYYYEQGQAQAYSGSSLSRPILHTKLPAASYPMLEPPAPAPNISSLAAVAATQNSSSSMLSLRPVQNAATLNSSSQNNVPVLSRQLSILHEHGATPTVAAQDPLAEARWMYLSARGRVSPSDREAFKERETALYEKEIDVQLRRQRLNELRKELSAKKTDLEKRVEQLNAQILYNESKTSKLALTVDTLKIQRTELEALNHKTALQLKHRQDREEALALQLIKSRSVRPQTEADVLRSKRLSAPIVPYTPLEDVGVTILFDSASQVPVAVSSSRMAVNLL